MRERDIFIEALQQSDPARRAAQLDDACQGDATLRSQVERLLTEHGRQESFILDKPPAGLDVTVDHRPISERLGAIIGPYKLLQQIGEGGMGVVFMAEQTEPIQRTVALKIIKPGMDTRQVIARFEAERQALALMDHPNIAKVLDVGATDAGLPYFVMDLVKGVPIIQYCDQQHLSIRERLELMADVCQAVQHAHQKGIIHRDLKPSNVLVAEYDSHPVPKIIDFGVAKATAQRLTERTLFTEYGQLVGTFEYMSPEQARFNQLDVDTRSDIYSLGVLLYELMTGSTPLDKERLRTAAFDEILRLIGEEEPPPPSTRLSSSRLLPSISAQRHSEPAKLTRLVRGELDWIVMRCLEKDRNRRYETASALGADLQRYLVNEPVEARPTTHLYRLIKFARRNRVGVLTGTAILAALAIGLFASLYFAAAASREAHRATAAFAEADEHRNQAEGVNRFFTEDVFSLADPNRYDKAGITLAEAVDNAAEMIDSRFPDDPVLRAVVHERFGKIYSEIDEPKKAVDQLKKAVELRQSAFGANDPRTLISRSDLGDALYKASRLSESKQSLESTLAAQTELFGPGNRDRIRTANILTIVLMNLHDPNDLTLAEQTYRDALRSHGANDPATLFSQADYSWVLRWWNMAGRTPDTNQPSPLELAEPAARGLRQSLGDGNVRAMFAWYGYAACLTDESRFHEAAKQFQKLLTVRYRVLGQAHVDSLFTAWRLAESYELAGEPGAAADVLEEVRSRLPLIESADKVRRAEPLTNLANVSLRVEREDLAREFAEAAHRMYMVTLNSDGKNGVNFEQMFELVAILATKMQPVELHRMALTLATRANDASVSANFYIAHSMAVASLSIGEEAASERWLHKAIELNHKRVDLHANLALLRLHRNDLEGYRSQCAILAKLVLATSDESVQAGLAFACCLAPAALPDLSQSLRIAKKLSELNPKKHDYIVDQGILEYRTKDFQSSQRTLSRIISHREKEKRRPTEAEFYARLFFAMAQWQLGDESAARQTLSEAQADMNKYEQTIWNLHLIRNLYRHEAEELMKVTDEKPTKKSPT